MRCDVEKRTIPIDNIPVGTYEELRDEILTSWNTIVDDWQKIKEVFTQPLIPVKGELYFYCSDLGKDILNIFDEFFGLNRHRGSNPVRIYLFGHSVVDDQYYYEAKQEGTLKDFNYPKSSTYKLTGSIARGILSKNYNSHIKNVSKSLHRVSASEQKCLVSLLANSQNTWWIKDTFVRDKILPMLVPSSVFAKEYEPFYNGSVIGGNSAGEYAINSAAYFFYSQRQAPHGNTIKDMAWRSLCFFASHDILPYVPNENNAQTIQEFFEKYKRIFMILNEADWIWNTSDVFLNVQNLIKNINENSLDEEKEIFMLLCRIQKPDDYRKAFLEVDYKRANMGKYTMDRLTDMNQGSWDLYEKQYQYKGKNKPYIGITMKETVWGRPPAMDITSGVCAIDFGTKSTTVVCRHKDNRLLRIGKGDFTEAPVSADYENPTAIEFRNLDSFLKSYTAREGRPDTKWEDLTISHTALAALLLQEDAEQPSVFFELKQWARNREKLYQLQDLEGKEILLQPYEDLSEDDVDPIELYAYYLGLYINNMVQGICLEYVLSFPVNYEQAVSKRICESFKRGILKSLPQSILDNEEIMDDFRVYLGASEPAAYATCALQVLSETDDSISPEEGKDIYYSVFDFGGGTTDFDYGCWRLAGPKERGYHYVIEQFHSGGDVLLGGEHLIRLMAYETFKENVDVMREKGITIAKPEEAVLFPGSEMLLVDSGQAQYNLWRLADKMRPIWEESSDVLTSNSEMTVHLFARGEEKPVAVPLNVDVDALKSMIKSRITRGVDNFFTGLYHAIKNKNVSEMHILLAGNSCKSSILKEVFAEYIANEEKILQETRGTVDTEGEKTQFYILHEPLSIGDDEDIETTPTGKTGVAFGLIDCRRGGNRVKVINHNISKETNEIGFNYYLGQEDRKGCFEVLINKMTPYNVWTEYIVATDDRFDVYYTEQAGALNHDLDISLVGHKRCRLHFKNDDIYEGVVFIRKTGPREFEYVAAESNEAVEKGDFLTEVEKIVIEK